MGLTALPAQRQLLKCPLAIGLRMTSEHSTSVISKYYKSLKLIKPQPGTFEATDQEVYQAACLKNSCCFVKYPGGFQRYRDKVKTSDVKWQSKLIQI